MKNVKVFGLPRSCTNLTEYLLKKFFEVEVFTNAPCGWKHGFLDKYCAQKTGLSYIVCVKRPVDWLWSLYLFENPKRSKTPYEFLVNPSKTYLQSPLRARCFRPLQAFNEIVPNWISLLNNTLHKTALVHHEDLLYNIEDAFSEVKKMFCQKEGTSLKLPEKQILPCCQKSQFPWKRKKHEFNKKEVAYIKNNISHDLVYKLGYSV